MSDAARAEAPESGGRAFLQALYAASKLGAMWGFENRLSDEALTQFESVLRNSGRTQPEVVFRLLNDLAYLGDHRIRVDSAGYGAYCHVRERAERRGVGEIRFSPEASRRDLMALLTLLEGKPAADADGPTLLADSQDELRRAGVSAISLAAPTGGQGRGELGPVDVREAAIRAYFRLSFVAKQTQEAFRTGRAPNVRRCKRVVHEVIDVLERGDHLLLAMTQVKNHHRYETCHAANTAVLACALALRAGLHKLRAADIGVAALVHEPSPHDPSRPGAAALASRDARAACTVLEHFGFADGSLRAMLAIRDLHRPARDSAGAESPLVQRILRICCFYDAETTPGGPDHPPRTARQTFAAMARDDGRLFDPVLVRVLRGVVGVYPFGTVVTLDSGERAIVHGRNPHFDQPGRPRVRVFETADGARVRNGETIDLSRFDRESSRFVRSISDERPPCLVFRRAADFVRVL